MDFGLGETANRENPPHTVSLPMSAAGEVRTERRDDLDIVLSLGNYVKQFLFAALAAYGDLLVDKRTPPTEAVREFEQHADELLQETFDRKWFFGLRRLELLEAEFAERFWPMPGAGQPRAHAESSATEAGAETGSRDRAAGRGHRRACGAGWRLAFEGG
jgi:hypothetical protein